MFPSVYIKQQSRRSISKQLFSPLLLDLIKFWLIIPADLCKVTIDIFGKGRFRILEGYIPVVLTQLIISYIVRWYDCSYISKISQY